MGRQTALLTKEHRKVDLRQGFAVTVITEVGVFIMSCVR